MGIKFTGSDSLGAPLDRNGIGPIDQRSVVQQREDLLSINTCYDGQLVYVENEKIFYVCRRDHSNTEPPTADDWVPLAKTFDFSSDLSAAVQDLAGAMHYKGTVHKNSWEFAWNGANDQNGDVYYIGEEILFPNMNVADPTIATLWKDPKIVKAGGYEGWKKDEFLKRLPLLFNLPTKVQLYSRELSEFGLDHDIVNQYLPVGTVTPGSMVIYTNYYKPRTSKGQIGWINRSEQILMDKVTFTATFTENQNGSSTFKPWGGSEVNVDYPLSGSEPEGSFYAKAPSAVDGKIKGYVFTPKSGPGYTITELQIMYPHDEGWVYIATTDIYTDNIGFNYSGAVPAISKLPTVFTRGGVHYLNLDEVLEKIISKVWWSAPTISANQNVGSDNKEIGDPYTISAGTIWTTTITDPGMTVSEDGNDWILAPATTPSVAGTAAISTANSVLTHKFTLSSAITGEYTASKQELMSLTVPYKNESGVVTDDQKLLKKVFLYAGKSVFFAWTFKQSDINTLISSVELQGNSSNLNVLKAWVTQKFPTFSRTTGTYAEGFSFSKITKVTPDQAVGFVLIYPSDYTVTGINLGVADSWDLTGSEEDTEIGIKVPNSSADNRITRKTVKYNYFIKVISSPVSNDISITYNK